MPISFQAEPHGSLILTAYLGFDEIYPVLIITFFLDDIFVNSLYLVIILIIITMDKNVKESIDELENASNSLMYTLQEELKERGTNIRTKFSNVKTTLTSQCEEINCMKSKLSRYVKVIKKQKALINKESNKITTLTDSLTTLQLEQQNAKEVISDFTMDMFDTDMETMQQYETPTKAQDQIEPCNQILHTLHHAGFDNQLLKMVL